MAQESPDAPLISSHPILNGPAEAPHRKADTSTSTIEGFAPRLEPLNVLVVIDRADRARGAFWRETLTRELSDDRRTRVICRAVPDEILGSFSPQGTTMLECLQNADVCIVNWDTANDDPDFGADLTRRWFQHRQLAILNWVFSGGILIIEGQANLGVPTQEAYDAMVGKRELRVCGPEDALDARKQELRVGCHCQLTKQARRTRLFGLLPSQLVALGHRDHDHMFPPNTAGKLVARFLRRGQWPLLYRGWFRRQQLRRRRLGWVPLVRTAARRVNHPTLLVARSGSGAVFASTMLLASSRQLGLIEAMLDTHGNAHLLPTPWRLTMFLSRHKFNVLLPLVVAIGLGAASYRGPLQRFFEDAQDPWSDLKKALFTLTVLGSFTLLVWLARKLGRFLREAIGV